MLVDEQNANVFPLTRELVKCSLNSCSFRLGVNNEEVLLRIWWIGDVLLKSVFVCSNLRRDNAHTPMPASKRPVTESWAQCQ